MTGFSYHDSTLACDDVPLAEIAQAIGTPLYVYSAGIIQARYRELDEAFSSHRHTIHYALKANSTLAIVRLLRALGSAVDANSGGEIELALRAGFIPPQIVFTGVGKSPDELARAVVLGVKAINAESAGELERIDHIARHHGTRARVAVRINPDIDALSHPHISTGLKTNKFGIPLEEARQLCRGLRMHEGLELVGVHIHVGSQITTIEPLRRAAAAALELWSDLAADGIRLEHLDVGGGLGISYDGTLVPTAAEYAQAVLSVLESTELEVLLEPGRAILGPAGVLVARVVDVKPQPGGYWFVVLDAGMTELLRPMLYGAYHRIVPADHRPEPEVTCDIVGPLCESSDTLGAERRLPLPHVGDLVAVLDAGAYGSVMASNYNRRSMPAEVLVDGTRWRVIRRRQTIDDLLACEE
ncbi:MAG: diaminopimelate decarboxylase [Acidobacteria bacterium]|nr:diaminopimelate decarboxylase [Acidobacteriota bacterium]